MSNFSFIMPDIRTMPVMQNHVAKRAWREFYFLIIVDAPIPINDEEYSVEKKEGYISLAVPLPGETVSRDSYPVAKPEREGALDILGECS